MSIAKCQTDSDCRDRCGRCRIPPAGPARCLAHSRAVSIGSGEARLSRPDFPNSYPGKHNGEPGDRWGDVDAGFAQAEVKIDQVYTTPIQHHNPMEPHATIAQWEGDRLSLHDATQHISGVQGRSWPRCSACRRRTFDVITLFVGGGFGCKGQIWSHVVLAAMAAKQVKRPVKLVLERPQMFGPVGARPLHASAASRSAQPAMGSSRPSGTMVHANTSLIEDYLESSAFPTRVMYACPNISTTSRLVPLNLGTPTYMRAPGVATGTYALEVAMDELAYELKMDPLAVSPGQLCRSRSRTAASRSPRKTCASVTSEPPNGSAGPSVSTSHGPCGMGTS